MSPSLIIVFLSQVFTGDKQIKKLNERALRLLHNDYNSTIKTLLAEDNTFSNHHQNIHCLLVETFKVVHGVTKNEILKI